MIELLTSVEAVVFYISFWILIEFQDLGKQIAQDNPFEVPPAVLSLPESLKNITLLLSNVFVSYFGIVVILSLAFFVELWYYPVLTVIIGYAFALLQNRYKPITSILGYKGLSTIGFLWIIGFVYYGFSVIINY